MTRCLPPETPAVLAFRGPDAVRYLNGQLTQNVADLADRSLPACVTDAKGRLQFFTSVFRGRVDDEVMVAGDPARSAELLARLERYLIADEVEIETLTGRWSRLHSDTPIEGACLVRSTDGPFGSGIDHWFPAAELPDVEPAPDDEIETLRITAGLPLWGRELEDGMLPPEAGLDRTAISYRKGCYIGQEVLSRIKSVGRVNRRLARLATDAPDPAALVLDGKSCGALTSIAPLPGPDGSRAALGYIKKPAYDHREFETETGHPVQFVDWA